MNTDMETMSSKAPPAFVSVILILSKVALNCAAKFPKSASGAGGLAVCPARNSNVPPLTLTAVERESCGIGSTNSFLSFCANAIPTRFNSKEKNTTTVFIAPTTPPSLQYSNPPLFFKYRNRLYFQKRTRGSELSRFDEGAG